MLSRITADFIETYPADAARVLEDAAPEVVGEALAVLPAPVAAAVLRVMTPHAAAGGLACLASGAAAALVRHLPIELAAALLLRLDPGERGALIEALPPTLSVPLRMVLRFPADSVGSLIESRVFTRMLHKSLVRELARPFNVGLFEYIGACVFASHG